MPKEQEYWVKIILGGHVIRSNKGHQKTNFNQFNERIDQHLVQLPYADIDDFGHVFILLMDGDTPVSYYVDSIQNHTNPNAQYKWV